MSTDQQRARQEPVVGDAVRIYWNLHRGCFSVQRGELIAGYRDSVVLDKVEFKVNATARRSVLIHKRKNVHAKVHGIIADQLRGGDDAVEVRYDPYLCGSFYSRQHPGMAVIAARQCHLHIVDGHPVVLAVEPLLKSNKAMPVNSDTDMRPTHPDELYVEEHDEREFALQPSFSGDEFSKIVCYPVIVEAWDKVMGSGQAKRNYLHTFNEAERKKISRYHRQFHRWHLVSGTPRRVMLKLATLQLLTRAVNFFADPKAEQYRAR